MHRSTRVQATAKLKLIASVKTSIASVKTSCLYSVCQDLDGH